MAKPNHKIDHRRIRRILIMKWSSMGDVAISTALMQDICNAYPQAEIDINTLPPWDQLFLNDPRFTRVLAIDLHSKGLAGTLALLRAIKAGRYDLIVDLQSNDRSRILLTLLHLFFYRVPHRVGNHRRYPYTIAPSPPAGKVLHAYEHQRMTLEAMGIAVTTPRPVLHVEDQYRRRVAGLLANRGLEPHGYAVFLPGCDANGWLKRWGAANYAGLAELLHRRRGYKVALIGARDEQEECDAIAAKVNADWLVNLCGQTAMQEIIPLCEQSAAIIANDTGTAHIASCSPTPMVVVCGATDPRRIKPVGPNVIALQTQLECINCYCKKPCDHDKACMQAISPALVMTYLEEAEKKPAERILQPEEALLVC